MMYDEDLIIPEFMIYMQDIAEGDLCDLEKDERDHQESLLHADEFLKMELRELSEEDSIKLKENSWLSLDPTFGQTEKYKDVYHIREKVISNNYRISSTIQYYNQEIDCRCCDETKKVFYMYREAPTLPFGGGAGFLFCKDCHNKHNRYSNEYIDNGSNLRIKCEFCGFYGCTKKECEKPDIPRRLNKEEQAFMMTMNFMNEA